MKADWLAAQSLDKAALLQGAGKLPVPAEPDFLDTTISINEQPEIVLTAEAKPDDLDQSFQLIALASSRLGKGKILVFSTAAYFRRPLVQQAEVQKLLANCLSRGSSARRKRVQVWGGDDALTTLLTQQARVRLVGTAATLDPSADVLLLSQEVTDTAMVRRVERFVRQGGTLLYGYPLPLAPLAPFQKLSETRFNQLLSQAGLLQNSYLTVRYPRWAFFSAGSGPKCLGIRAMLEGVRAGIYQLPPTPTQGGYLFSYTLEQALAQNPADASIQKRIRQAAHYSPDSLIVPTPERPVKMGQNYSAYFVQRRLQENQLREHLNPAYVAPAAATFPGAVPATAAHLATELVVPVQVGFTGNVEPVPGSRRVHSTGLYVPAGEKVVIYLASNDSSRHMQAQIGVHDDEITNKPQFTREAFHLTRRFELTRGRTEIYLPYGGLLLPTPRRHPERIIVDQEVVNGYMFTTADKTVVPNDEYGCQRMLDADYLWKNGSWGHFHELGHRHQFRGIDFEGLSEVIVNLCTMYVFDKLLHKGLYEHNHERLRSKQQVAEIVTHYLTNSPSFEKWKSDPFWGWRCTYNSSRPLAGSPSSRCTGSIGNYLAANTQLPRLLSATIGFRLLAGLRVAT